MARFICSCILAWSSWDSSFWRSVSFSCSAEEFWATAPLAASAAWADCRWSCLSDSTSFSVATSLLAKASAARVYSVALSWSPLLDASSAMSTA